jgi:hypothetical protein
LQPTRPELPHLTILFKTTSGEIDGHLKDEMADPGVYPYTPLFRIPTARLNDFEVQFAPNFSDAMLRLFKNARKVRPGWLKRNGYVLAISHSDELKARFLEAAPKIRGRRRVDLSKLKAAFEDASQVSLLDPSALQSLELKNHVEPILAVRGFGKNRMLGLIYAPRIKRSRAWLVINPLLKAMPKVFLDVIPVDMQKNARDIWFKIHDALRLDEIGIRR